MGLKGKSIMNDDMLGVSIEKQLETPKCKEYYYFDYEMQTIYPR
jgi:hypothetical protein